MYLLRLRFLVLAVAAILFPSLLVACSPGDAAASAGEARKGLLTVTIRTAAGQSHSFRVERAVSPAEQQRGLMYRTDLAEDGGMLFWPYPGDGGPPREASFWMKNTPTSLDIIYIREDGTIARIAENTVPFSEEPIPSGEPVAAVLEVVAGRTAALGIAPGDSVSWPGQ